MPKFEGITVETRDDGKLEMSSLPEPVRNAVQAEFDRAFGKGAEKAATEAKAQLETEITRVREEAKKTGVDPSKDEKLKNMELELSKLKEDQALRDKNYEEAQRLRDERHAKEIGERESKVTAAQSESTRILDRLKTVAASEIRVAAIKAGARDESLGELELLLGRRVELDPKTLEAFVADDKDAAKPALTKDGKSALTIDGLVQEYLADHPHHKAAPGGRGGGAAGGRSLSGQPLPKGTEFDAAVERVASNPSVASVAAAFGKIQPQA